MRVQHNIAAMNSYRNFGVNNSKMAKNLEKLSSGYAINRAGDDAAGLAVSEKMRYQISGLEAGIKNAKDGIGLIQTAEGALTEVHDMLNRMYYLADQSANGTYTAGDRSNLNDEFTELKNEITRIGNTANFNGMDLFKGSTAIWNTTANQGIRLIIGDDGTKGDNRLQLKAKYSQNNITLNGTNTLKATNLKLDTVAITKASATNAGAFLAMSRVKNAINAVSSVRSKLGAYQNRLEHTVNNLGVMRENIQDAESRIRDTDVAEEMMKFTKNSIMNQASQAMLAQSNQLPQGVLQLLQ